MWKATLKGLIKHKLRLILTVLAIVGGVAFVSGSFVLTDTLGKFFTGFFSRMNAGVDISVRPEMRGSFAGPRAPIPADVVPKIAALPGVKSVEGKVGGIAQVVDKSGAAIRPRNGPVLGVSWGKVPELNVLKLKSGQAPMAPDECLIDTGTASRYGFKIGDTISVVTTGPVEKFRLVGLATFGPAEALEGSTLVAFETATAQRVLNLKDKFQTIDIAARSDSKAAIESLRSAVQKTLPEGFDAVSVSALVREATQRIEEGVRSFSTVLLVFAGISLFVGSFIIFNTFTIILAQRSREFALLRALGASSAQVMRSVVGEAAIVGAVASAIGLFAGIGAAKLLQKAMTFIDVDIPPGNTILRPRTALVSIGVGVGVTMIASLVPAIRAARTAPVTAMRELTPKPKALRWRVVTGAVLGAAGIVLLMIGLFADIPSRPPVVGAGTAGIFFGVAIAAPILVTPVAGTIGAPMARLRGFPGKLARQNSMRDQRRTAATASALMIGLSLVSFATILTSSLKVSVRDLIEDFFRADLILTSQRASFGFSPEVAKRLRDQPGVAVASEVKRGRVAIGELPPEQRGGTQVFGHSVAAMDPATMDQVVNLDIQKGSIAALQRGEVLVQKEEAETLKLGDAITLRFPLVDKPLVTKVGGVFASSVAPGQYIVSLETYQASLGDQLAYSVLVKKADGTTVEQLRRTVRSALKDFPQIDIEDRDDVFQNGERDINRGLNFIRLLLGLAIMIAFVGIANTMSLSVIERTRELGLLRAVGMTRAQVRSMIRMESVIVALLGAVMGLALGIFFGWSMVRALRDDGITSFFVPVGELLVIAVIAGALGVLAGLFPAHRGSRLDVLEAIATE